MSRNDQPYSSPWEKYELLNLNGGGSFYVEGSTNWDTVFK